MCCKKKKFAFILKCKETGEEYEQEIIPGKPGIGLQEEEILSVERDYLDGQICGEKERTIYIITEVPKEEFEEEKKILKEVIRHKAKPLKEKTLNKKYKPVALWTALGYTVKKIENKSGLTSQNVRQIRSRIYKQLGVFNPASLREWMEKRNLL